VRYAPGRPFPPYAFLPGRDPHPTRDPHGHSFERPEEPCRFLPAERWRENEPYLFGADLYNHGFLWEAHEAWEGLWHVSKPDRLAALHLQGLIQCAAAWLKIPMRQPEGVRRLAELALAKLEEVALARGPRYMGLELADFAAAVRAFADSRPGALEGYPRIVLED
jgi:hypothetical protein